PARTVSRIEAVLSLFAIARPEGLDPPTSAVSSLGNYVDILFKNMETEMEKQPPKVRIAFKLGSSLGGIESMFISRMTWVADGGERDILNAARKEFNKAKKLGAGLSINKYTMKRFRPAIDEAWQAMVRASYIEDGSASAKRKLNAARGLQQNFDDIIDAVTLEIVH
ncbi:MAG: hypothetical protein OEQ39_24685, partial [Gammaproteobacteria bacterium]|nr:hypothetical protein [Gammaproteobacteria bacterium]